MIDEFADPVRQMHRDRAIAQFVQQIKRPWSPNLVMRGVVAEPEVARVEMRKRLTNEIRRWPRQHILERENNPRSGRNWTERLTHGEQPLQPRRQLRFVECERTSMRNHDGRR